MIAAIGRQTARRDAKSRANLHGFWTARAQ
jgi:hypothetical protein